VFLMNRSPAVKKVAKTASIVDGGCPSYTIRFIITITTII
jgi:hypothetical protein